MNSTETVNRVPVGTSSVIAGSPPFWPCPHNCLNWCRADGSMTNHHPRCEYVDASLMDVWSVRIPGEQYGCVTHCEADAHAMAIEDPHALLEVVKLKMHREIYENLPEFAGF